MAREQDPYEQMVWPRLAELGRGDPRTFARKGLVLVAFLVLITPTFARAQSVDSLTAQINAHNQQITDLEAEIKQYQAQLDTLGQQKNTLKSTVSSLTISQKQLSAQISITQNKISSANLQLAELTNEISDKESTIAADQAAIAKALRAVAQVDAAPMLERVIAADGFATAWQAADQSTQFNRALDADIQNLSNAKVALGQNRDAVSTTKSKLVSLNTDLSTQKHSVDANKATTQTLIVQTNNQESAYQKLIAQKEASERAFEQELTSLQGQLNLIVHPGSLPKTGNGTLSWPFSLTFMNTCASRQSLFSNLYCITQYFGNTAFSTANPQIYNGHGHNAIDIAAPIGTPVDAALGGVVYGTGNTDLVRGCYSFGKWVMIKHPNGINTLYAHLSSILVSTGQSVSTGDVIGLSGMTGYATGPHLHFGVYATEGTEIMTLRAFRGASAGCADATMPVATLDAYLNPLSYL